MNAAILNAGRTPRRPLRRWMLRGFGRVYRFDRRFRQRFTAFGYLVLAGLGMAAVIGINTRLSLASQIFALLAGMLVLAVLSSLFFRPPLRVRRSLPPFATAGEPLRYTLRVENTGTKPQRGLFITDELVETLPSYDEFVRYHDPGDRHRNRFDRFVGYPKWLELTRQKQGAEAVAKPLPAIAGGAAVEIDLPLLLRRRGYVRFQGFCVTRPDPLGIVNAIRRIEAAGALLVLPKRYRVNKLALPGNRLYQPGGVTLASANGDAEEFVSLRDYRPGDSWRDIHWKSWAKLQKPIVKEKRPEYFARHALILDTFVTAGGETVFEEAVAVAASFLATLDTQETLLDLIFVGAQAYRFTMGRGLGDNAHLLKILACVEGSYDQAFSRLHDAVMPYAGQFSGCILVLLDWDSPRQRLRQSLQSRNIQTLSLVVTADKTLTGSVPVDVIELPISQIAEKLRRLPDGGGRP